MAYQNRDEQEFEQYQPPAESQPIIADGIASPNGSTLVGSTNSTIQLEALGFAINNGGYLRSGMTDYNVGNGWWIGNKGGIGMFSFGSAPNSSITWNGTNLNVGGSISVTSLNIPDSVTANSFHVDSLGNAWWGSNVATGYTGANAYVLNTGAAFFNNIKVGGTTTQYTITNGGVGNFGDGSDGTGSADGSTALAGASLAANVYTLSRDVYYTNLTISTGVTIKPNGYRIFGTGTLTMNGTAIIQRNGNAGTKGGTDQAGNGDGGAGGAALADGYLKGSPAGGTGQGYAAGSPQVAPTVAASSVTNSIGVSGAPVSVGFATGTATASNVKLIANWHLATLLDVSSTGSTVKFTGSASSGGGPTGSQGGSGVGGGGGGGSGGAVILVYNQLNNTGSVEALGGNGGISGSALGGGHSGAGFGGGGGSPGAIVAIYFRSIVIGASAKIQSNGGAGGAGGDAFTGTSSAGNSGITGIVYQFGLSL